MTGTVVDTQALLDTVLAAVVSGLGVTLVFSVAIFAAARFGEMSRAGRGASALTYGVLTVLAGLTFAAAIVIAIIVMTTK